MGLPKWFLNLRHFRNGDVVQARRDIRESETGWFLSGGEVIIAKGTIGTVLEKSSSNKYWVRFLLPPRRHSTIQDAVLYRVSAHLITACGKSARFRKSRIGVARTGKR